MSKSLKSITIIKHDIVLPSVTSDELTESEHPFSKKEFNPQGQVLKEINYSAGGEIEQILSYKYNPDGFLIEDMLIENEDEVIERKTYEPYNGNKIKKEYRHYFDETYDTIDYKYDNAGNLIEKVTYDHDGDVELQESFDYDGKKLVKESVFDENNELISEKSFTYTDNDLLSSTSDYNSEDDKEIKRITEYDDQGYREELLTYDDSGKLIERVQFEHDEKGNLVEVIEETPVKKNTIKMQYDENGNLTLQEEFDKNGKLLNKVERVYDDNNRVLESRAYVEIPERAIIRNYTLKYHYEFFE